MAIDQGNGGGVDTPFNPQLLPEGKPVIEYGRVYSALSPFGLQFEFRPQGFENWTEKIEGDTHVEIIIDETTMARLSDVYDGPYSLIISLIASGPIKRRIDISDNSTIYGWSNFAYDSYYIQAIIKEGGSYRLTCVGAKEYLSKRLAIPASRNSTNGVISTPDGSDAAKPIPSDAILSFSSRSQKGIIAGLLTETALLQPMPISWSAAYLTGSMQRTYLLKDMRSIKEAINNLSDDQGAYDIVFDGGNGSRSNVSFLMIPAGDIQRGIPMIEISTRTSEIFVPSLEYAQEDTVNNIWTVGNASDGNIILGHKVAAGTSGKILLQGADTQRNDIQTPDFLLQYTLGILARSGTYVRTMALNTGLTPKMFLAYTGNLLYFQAPEDPDLHKTFWRVVERKIDFSGKRIEFDLEEWILDNNGDGIPDRLQSL